MQFDRQITISTAGSRRATQWPPSSLMWSELIARLQTPVRSTETLAEYLSFKKGRQDDLKDVGGFVAGILEGDRRKANAVIGREVITLDLDNIQPGGTQDVLKRIEGLGCGYCVYSTRKHSDAAPRLRVLVPLSRTSTADEYEPCARKLASIIGIDLCDPSTFEASRLMYWPSCCVDSIYVHTFSDKPLLDVDGVLSMYGNWRDVTEWPQVPGTQDVHKRLAAKQGDPTEKSGVVGAFCKVYDVYRAIDELLPGEYLPCDIEDRYTFAGGSTTGGAVIYENGKFLYSHHATDPCGGKLCNAFDLVRLHKFSSMDDDAKTDTPTNRLPSYTAMCQYAVSDKYVASIINQERYDSAVQAFGDTPVEQTDMNWMSKLSISATTGEPQKTTDNVLIILDNDPNLKGRFAFDEFANRALVLGTLPWDTRSFRRQWTDTDDAGLRHYIEKCYGISGKERIYDAACLCAFKNKFNDVQRYLQSLQWDGVKRLDTLLIDYLGSEDNIYTRTIIRKSLVAAVARAMTPGVKYDCMPILTGPQGIGKSTFFKILGRSWHSDSLQNFEGKEAAELIQGTWIIEVGELNGLSRSEMNVIKQFLSRTEDIYREPYGRRTGNYPRRCVFFGTTNDNEFLRDQTGNRRFWPVDVGLNKPTKNVFKQLQEEVDQIWAEAMALWRIGEPLFLTGEAERLSLEAQDEHKENSAKEGVIREFLNKPLPPDWSKRDLGQRRIYWSGNFEAKSLEGLLPRDRVCAVEIWCECFNGETKNFKKAEAAEINGILSGMKEWSTKSSSMRFGFYGVQKGFSRV
ncbi:MAG: virulence-associated E family protein [Oscillospiraceae bacterium]